MHALFQADLASRQQAPSSQRIARVRVLQREPPVGSVSSAGMSEAFSFVAVRLALLDAFPAVGCALFPALGSGPSVLLLILFILCVTRVSFFGSFFDESLASSRLVISFTMSAKRGVDEFRLIVLESMLTSTNTQKPSSPPRSRPTSNCRRRCSVRLPSVAASCRVVWRAGGRRIATCSS